MPAGPRLDAGIQINDAARAAVVDQRQAGDIEGGIEQKVAGLQLAVQNAAVIVLRERLDAETRRRIRRRSRGPSPRAVIDRDVVLRHVDVAQHERQSALANGAEADDQDLALERDSAS